MDKRYVDDMLPEGNSWATIDTVETSDKNLHVKGTLRKGGDKYSFHMFNPPTIKPVMLVRCGMCREDMTEYKSCPNCFPWRLENNNGTEKTSISGSRGFRS
jgi:hypothetical protein